MAIATVTREMEDIAPKIRRILYMILVEVERQKEDREQRVTKKEFNELKEIVKDLADAQKKN